MKHGVAQCYSYCAVEEDKCYKIQRPSHIQFRDIAKVAVRIVRRRKERNLRIHVEKMGSYVEGQGDAESVVTTNCEHRYEIVCLFCGLTEGI